MKKNARTDVNYLDLSIILVLHDLEGNIIQVNDEFLKVFGYSRPEIHYLKMKDLYSENSNHWAQVGNDVTRRKSVIREEVIFKRKNKCSFPAFVISSYLEIGDQDLIQSIAYDVSELKRKEERMHIRDRAFASVTNGILITDAKRPDNPIIHCNPAFEKITGYSRDDIIGKNCRFLYDDDSSQEGIKELRNALNEGRGCTVLLRNYKKDGTLFWNELTISPIEDDSGKLTHFVGIINDVTERKAAEELQSRHHAELEQMVRNRTAELAKVNEELRNEVVERRKAEEAVRTRAHQQAIVAELGQKAMKGIDLSTLMNETVSIVAQTLGVEYCKILELLPSGKELLLRAGVGWKEEYLGRATVGAGRDSQAGFTLLSKEPVIVEDLRHDSRFTGPDLLIKHRVISGISTVIHDRKKPFGVLGAHTTKRRLFTSDDVNFLQAIANLIAQAIERKNAEDRLRNAFDEIKQLKDQLETEKIYLQEEMNLEYSHGDIMGRSAAIKDVLSQVEQVADSDTTVLLLGETGTGKELLAHAIHHMSKRRDRVMVKMHCSALPSQLIESELFGYEKGAFTGAIKRKMGRFEVANGSTIFLDEIGDMSLETQPKLLRVLNDGRFYRLGSAKDIITDVRVIAATNRDLEKAVKEGKFRQDLYYRLNVFSIYVPPLRERKEDIPLLVTSFVKEFADTIGKKIDEIPKRVIETLQAYHWPGNIRELRNVIERAVILNKGRKLSVELPMVQASPSTGVMELVKIEKRHIVNVLERAGWRIRGPGGAAEILGLKPTTLASRMQKLGIRRKK